MDLALPLQSVLTLNKSSYSRKTINLSQAKGTVHATTSLEIGTTNLPHYHEDPHLSFIVKGGIVDKRKASENERSSGDLLFFHAGEPHQTINRIFPSVCVSLELAPSYLQENNIAEARLSSLVAKNPRAKFTMVKIYKELLVNDGDSDHSIEMLLLDLIENERLLKTSKPEWIDMVLDLLNEKWNEPVSLKKLADAGDVHPTTVSKHFTKYAACTLGEYRRRLKIEKSLDLIKRPDLSLTDIAYKCGFSDQSHFTRTFKQMTGFLPRHYENL